MDPLVAQLFAQIAETQRRFSDGLQATNHSLAALLAASDRRQETFLRETRDGRGRHWDDGDKFRNCKVYAGRSGDWEEWSELLMGTI